MHTSNDVHQQFAEYFGISELKPFAYLLSKKLTEGHICLDLDRLDEQLNELPDWYKELPIAANAEVGKIPLVATDGNYNQPFVLFQNRLYLQRYYRYETMCLERILQFLEDEKGAIAHRMKELLVHRDFIANLFASAPEASPNGKNMPDWQLAAAIMGALHNFTIITGGPGTGKTTTVAKLLAILYTLQPNMEVALAAPTGKAAARMAESLRGANFTGAEVVRQKLQALQPSTIHRLLKVKKDSHYFHHNAGNPLPYDVVIVDESSMIDVALFAKLLSAIGQHTRIILLGDKDQLASVEAGSLFGDLCQAQHSLNLFTAEHLAYINQFIAHAEHQVADEYCGDEQAAAHPLFEHLVELRRSRRFKGDKGIGRLSKAIIQNDAATLNNFLTSGEDEEVKMDTEYSQQLFESFIDGYADFIKETDPKTALKKLTNCRVLCALREGPQGLYSINKAIEHRLQQQKLIRVRGEFYENRPIMLRRNYYEHGLFNGDTGIIRPNSKGVLMAYFEDSEGNLIEVLPGYLTDVETAFAMTIHKSQGSEFDKVLVILPKNADTVLLTRELLYTAVTRAKSKVYVQSTAEVLLQTAIRRVERASGIASRFMLEKTVSIV